MCFPRPSTPIHVFRLGWLRRALLRCLFFHLIYYTIFYQKELAIELFELFLCLTFDPPQNITVVGQKLSNNCASAKKHAH